MAKRDDKNLSVPTALLLSGGAGVLGITVSLAVAVLIEAWPPDIRTEAWIFLTCSAAMLVWLLQIGLQERRK